MRRWGVVAIAGLVGVSCAGLALAFAGCANSTTATQETSDAASDARGDAPADAGGASDAPTDAPPDVGLEGVRCPSAPCEPGETCCAIQGASGPQLSCFSGTSCGDAGFVISCDGPEDCASDKLNPLCCGTLAVGSGTAPACPVESVSATCVATCDTSLAQACPGSSTVRLCHASSECTESAFPKCCAFTQGSVTARFCVDDSTSQFSASCL
jgi:hypothetical protein